MTILLCNIIGYGFLVPAYAIVDFLGQLLNGTKHMLLAMDGWITGLENEIRK